MFITNKHVVVMVYLVLTALIKTSPNYSFLFVFSDRKVFLAMWKDIPASNEVQKTIHCNVGSGNHS